MDDELEAWMEKANIARLLDQLRRGNPPPPKYVAACPVIKEWSTEVQTFTAGGVTRPEIVIVGIGATGTAVRTVGVRWIDCRRAWAIDTSALYRLGKPTTTYKDASDA